VNPRRSRTALFELLGTPAADKRDVLVEDAGYMIPRATLLRETVSWLDERLGPVR
jgi:hypothetical protein